MADVDITSLSVEISAESQGAELNINKLANAIANLRSKGNVSAVCDSLDKLAGSIAGLKSASKGIGSIFKNIEKMSNIDVSGIDFTGLSAKLESLKSELQPLQNLDASGLKAVGSAMNAIAKIPSINDKLDADTLNKFKTACDSIFTSLTPLASQLDKVGNAFAKLPPQLSKVVTQANRVTAANEKQRKSYLSLSNQMNGFMRNMAKLVSLKAIAEYLGNAVAKFNDFYEATDLFHNAMGNLSGEADTLISKMQGLLGVDPTKAMTYMATIQSLGTSFGLTSDKAYILSKNLTQLAYDEGSYWNKDVAETFTAMSSAISGEIEPIRRLGVDLTQARLQQELLALGFNKQVSSLSQADKAVLRYIAIMKQTANVQGNLAQTINSPANQIKILKAQLDMLAKSVGSLLYPALKSILPPLIAAVQLIREFVEWVAKLMGVKIVFTDFTKSADSVGGIGDAMDDTADSTKKAAKALKDYTMGFDELNIIDPTQGSSGSGSGASAGNILGDVDLSGYDMFKDYVGNTIDEIKEKLRKLAPIVAAIGAGFAAWAIGNALLNALKDTHDWAYKLGKLVGGLNPELVLIAATVALIVGRFVQLYQNSEAFRLGLARIKDLIYLAGLGFTKGWNISLTDGKLGESIKQLKESLKNLGQQILNLLPDSWKDNASHAFRAIRRVVRDLDLDLGDLAVTLVGIGLIISGHPVAGLAVIGFEAISVAIRSLGSESEAEAFQMKSDWHDSFQQLGIDVGDMASIFVTSFSEILNSISDFIRWITKGISESERLDVTVNQTLFPNMLLGLADLIADIQTFIRWVSEGPTEAERLDVTMNQGFIANALLGLADLIADIGTVIKWFLQLDDHIQAAGESFKKFLDGVENWASEAAKAASDMVKAVSDAIASLPSKMLDAGKNIWQGLVKGIQSGINSATGAAGNLAKAIIDKFTTDTEIHSPSKLFEQFGIYIDQGLANGITAAQGYVDEAMQGLINGVTNAGNQFIEKGKQTGIGFVNNLDQTLTSTWQQLDTNLQNDFFGTIQNLWEAAQSGDVKTIGTTIAAVLWHAMGEEQRTQIKTIATNMITDLSTQLTNALSTLSAQAYQIGGELLNGITSKFGEILQKTKQLGGSLSSTFQAVRGPLKSVATAISAALSGGLASAFPTIYASMGTLISTIGASFVAMLHAIGAALSATIFGIPAGLIALGAAAVLAVSIASIVGGMGGKKSSSSSSYGSTGYDESDLGQIDYSHVPGTSQYNEANSGFQSSYTASATQQLSASEIKEAVYNGAYNALLDYKQRYGNEDKNNIIKLFIDGKQVTAAVEKTQSDRGRAIMGNEAYSY